MRLSKLKVLFKYNHISVYNKKFEIFIFDFVDQWTHLYLEMINLGYYWNMLYKYIGIITNPYFILKYN